MAVGTHPALVMGVAGVAWVEPHPSRWPYEISIFQIKNIYLYILHRWATVISFMR